MAEDLPPEVMLPRLSRALSVCETQLAHELWSEEVKQPSKLQRIRSRGTDLLHSQGVLLAVVILNCVDCILVLSELMLDVYFVKDMIVTAEHTMKTFNRKLQERYPAQFFGLLLHDTHEFYNRVLRAHLMWNTTDKGAMEGSKSVPEAFYSVGGNNSLVVGLDSGAGPVFFYDADDPEFLEDVTLSAEEIVSHALHKTSIAILATLVIYTVLKVFCYGLSFVKHKMEVFDGIVVVASFTLDVCYIKGLTNYPVESFILILTIMVPWRVIRVLNSLVIAVKDNYHFMMKLMYRKSQFQRDRIRHLETSGRDLRVLVEALKDKCELAGVSIDHLKMAEDRRNDTKQRPFLACLSGQLSTTDLDTLTHDVSEHCLSQAKQKTMGEEVASHPENCVQDPLLEPADVNRRAVHF